MSITAFNGEKIAREVIKQNINHEVTERCNKSNLIIYLGVGHEQSIKNILTYLCAGLDLLQNRFKDIFVHVYNGQNIEFEYPNLHMLDYNTFNVNHLEPYDNLLCIGLKEEVSNALLELGRSNFYCMDAWSYEEMFFVIDCLHKNYNTSNDKCYDKYRTISALADKTTGIAVLNNYKLPDSAKPELHVAYKVLTGTVNEFIYYLKQ